MSDLNPLEIILIMIISFFFIFRWILIRLLPHKKQASNVLAVVSTLILTPLIYLGFSFIFFLYGSPFESQKSFDQQAWQSKADTRFRMQDDIVNNEFLMNKNKEQIIDLLGEPDQKDASDFWIYNMGMSTSGFPAIYSLKLKFENEQITKVEKIKHVD
jgi:hypothetical protein